MLSVCIEVICSLLLFHMFLEPNKLFTFKIDSIIHRSKVPFTFNRLTPNDSYMGRTAPLTSKRCILYIYSTNIGIEYFKHPILSVFSPSKCSLFHSANLFGSCIIHILYTGCAKIKKNNSGAKGLRAPVNDGH